MVLLVLSFQVQVCLNRLASLVDRAVPWYVHTINCSDWASRLPQGRLHNGVFKLKLTDVKMICVRSLSFLGTAKPTHHRSEAAQSFIYYSLLRFFTHRLPESLACRGVGCWATHSCCRCYTRNPYLYPQLALNPPLMLPVAQQPSQQATQQVNQTEAISCKSSKVDNCSYTDY
jgi:hypothetical protein